MTKNYKLEHKNVLCTSFGYVLVMVEPYKLLLQRVLNIYLLHTQPYKRKYNLLTFRKYVRSEMNIIP